MAVRSQTYVGRGYLHDLKDGKGLKSALFRPTIPATGVYEVRVSHCSNVRRAVNATITIYHADGEFAVQVNQQLEPEHQRLFQTIGTFPFAKGSDGWVRISNEGTDGKYVIVDAVQFLPAEL